MHCHVNLLRPVLDLASPCDHHLLGKSHSFIHTVYVTISYRSSSYGHYSAALYLNTFTSRSSLKGEKARNRLVSLSSLKELKEVYICSQSVWACGNARIHGAHYTYKIFQLIIQPGECSSPTIIWGLVGAEGR